MLRKTALIFLFFFFYWSSCAWSVQPVLASVPEASVVGRGKLSYAFWDIYEATLYAPKGRFDPTKSFALTIKYYHSIKGHDIANKSVEEMRKQGFMNEIKLAAWNTQLKSIFPDVKSGTILSAIYLPGQHTVFYEDNRVIGTVKGDDFAYLFFGIWLSDKSSKPELRRRLLGEL